MTLCLVAASCSGDGRATTTKESNTSSTLSSSGSAAGDVGTEALGTTDLSLAPPRPAPGASGGSSPAKVPGPASGTKQSTTSTTTGTGASTTTTLPPGLPPEKCPDAKTCRRYAYMDGSTNAANAARWPVGPDGFATVRYSVNPSGSGLSDEQVQGAVQAAFGTWQAAAPKLRLIFDGFTSRAPTPGDGRNDVGFVPGHTYAVPLNNGNAMTEADMFLTAAVGNWTWEPCEQRDDSCTSICVPNGAQTGCRAELQSIVTHEAGHWLWLGDMNDQTHDTELTMNPSQPTRDRFRSTLALGDVLGVRSLYPCSCPLPPIYDP